MGDLYQTEAQVGMWPSSVGFFLQDEFLFSRNMQASL